MFKHERNFIRKHRLTSRNLSYAQLEQIFFSLGYEIVFFNKYDNSHHVQELIKTYELEDEISHRKSFLLVDNFIKLLFLHERMGEDELIHYMLHELGHIWLNHLPDTYNDDKQEREADEFAVLVKVYLWLKPKIQKAVTLCSLLMLILNISIYFTCTSRIPEHPRPTTDIVSATAPPVAVSDSEIDVVYMITGRNIFHKRTCRHIKNSSDIFELPYNDAVTSGHRPCKDCFSELY